MAVIEVETLWHSITKSAGYFLLGASLGMYYGCTRESARFELKYNKQMTSIYKDLKEIVPTSKYHKLEEIVLEEK